MKLRALAWWKTPRLSAVMPTSASLLFFWWS